MPLTSYQVFIEGLNGLPLEDQGYCAYVGFNRRKTPVRVYDADRRIPISKDVILVACIETTEKYLKDLGVTIPRPLNIPPALEKYCKRKVWITTVEEARKEVPPFFIKPHEQLKQFLAGVIKTQSFAKIVFDEMPQDRLVMMSEYVDIVSEYRGFVIDGNLVSLNLYTGDFRMYPDTKIIDQAVADYKDAPAGYTIDFGVTAAGETILIECNDGWAIGSYGCDPELYTKLLSKRWLELTVKRPHIKIDKNGTIVNK